MIDKFGFKFRIRERVNRCGLGTRRGALLLALLGVLSASQSGADQSEFKSIYKTQPFVNYQESSFSVRSFESGKSSQEFVTPLYNEFEHLTDYAVIDHASGLVWQKQDDATFRSWDKAKDYCQSLQLDGKQWRLPSRAELLSIVDYTKSKPAIDERYFPNTQLFNYWASTPYTGTPEHAWSVLFSEGNAYCFLRQLENYVRCVQVDG